MENTNIIHLDCTTGKRKVGRQKIKRRKQDVYKCPDVPFGCAEKRDNPQAFKAESGDIYI